MMLHFLVTIGVNNRYIIHRNTNDTFLCIFRNFSLSYNDCEQHPRIVLMVGNYRRCRVVQDDVKLFIYGLKLTCLPNNYVRTEVAYIILSRILLCAQNI